jgi:hypothetical protein
MCMDVRKRCECGAHTIQFHLRDNIMLPEVISRLFCPACPGNTSFDGSSMLYDNGWVIEYDMELACSLAEKKLKIDSDTVIPGFLFDSGYICWQEMYPGEQADIKDERQKIIELLKEDRQQYLEAMQIWNINRIEQLKAQGWRKVQRA